MKNLKRFVSLATLSALLFSTTPLKAQGEVEYYEDGNGYNNGRRASIAPAVALGAIAVAAIIALAIQNSNNGHHHDHS